MPDMPGLDALVREIVRFQGPKLRPVTVVWLFDRSRSMLDDRRPLRQKLTTVARDLERVKRVAIGAGLVPPPENPAKDVLGISHLVVEFGQSSHLVDPEPTESFNWVLDAFDRLTIDESGVENTFHAIARAIREADDAVPQTTRLMLVVATDEAGNDDHFHEDARTAAIESAVPMYVIGRQALFGMTRARLHAAPDGAPHPTIRRGPESAELEVLAWDGLQSRDDEQPSGFAPYALGRLAKDTGGIFFMLPWEEHQRVHLREKAYSILTLRAYAPDYDNRSAYIVSRERSRLRHALHESVEVTRHFALPLRFPYEPAPIVESLADAGAKAERQRTQLAAIEATLRALEHERDREPSRRWQAHYDLTLAQVVAFQITVREYRAAVVALRGKADTAQDDAPPAWEITHGRERQAPRDGTQAGYDEAERLLQLVVERHPDTPWADLARTIRERGLSVGYRQLPAKQAPQPPAESTQY